MKRYKLFVVLVMLTAGLTLVLRSCHLGRALPPDMPSAAIRYRLNDSIRNAVSDLSETARMERSIRSWMARNNIRGATLAVMRDERLVYCKGFGWADAEAQRPVEAGDIFRIASASKLITAIGIMKLCEEGRLSTDARVFGPDGILGEDLFPEIKDKRATQITVRHLLTHTAGFSRRLGDPMFRSADVIRWTGRSRRLTADDVIAFQLGQRLRDTPGGMAQYSNVGYLILSRIIEQISGLPYETYIRRHVLYPAGCYDMYIARNTYAERHPREVKYYGHDPGELIASYDGSGAMRPREYGGNDITGLQGAGAWVCSSAELLRLVASIDGRSRVPDILSARSIAEMKEIRRKGDFGYGWARCQAGSGNLVRTGTMSGTCAYIDYRPNGLSFVLITNTSNYRGAAFTNSIGGTIRDALAKVSAWPTDRDLFTGIPRVRKEE